MDLDEDLVEWIYSDEIRTLDSSDIIGTDLATCVGIAIYDPLTKTGVIGHSMIYEEYIEEALEKAKEIYSNMELLEVVLTGCNYCRGHDVRTPTDYLWETSKALLLKYNLNMKNVKMKRAPLHDGTILILNCTTGEIICEHQYEDF